MKNIALVVCMLFALILSGQPEPTRFSLSGCSTMPIDLNGSFTRSAIRKNLAWCYTKDGSADISIEYLENPVGSSNFEWVITNYVLDPFAPCAGIGDRPSLFSTISTDMNTNIANVSIGGATCALGGMISVILPTMGQWGIMCLMTLMIIVGIVAHRSISYSSSKGK